MDEKLISERSCVFAENLSTEEMAKLLVLALSETDVERISVDIGLDVERKKIEKAIELKRGKSNEQMVSFGGKSIYGTIIDVACRTYGWTVDYVVWGISYASLRLLMRDAVVSMTLSKKECKKLHVRQSGGGHIDGDSPQNISALQQLFC